MKTIIDNKLYDSDRCELVALRKRRKDGVHEYLLRSPGGTLLLAEASYGTPLGRGVWCGDIVTDTAGKRRIVKGAGSGTCLLIGEDAEVPHSAVFPRHGDYHSMRTFVQGEPCDGFYVDRGEVAARLIELGLVQKG